MDVKAVVTAIILIANFHFGCSQILACEYKSDYYIGYICDLLLYDPNESYNFSRVSGTHLAGKTDQDVRHISRHSSSKSPYIPSIICKTFPYATTFDLSSVGITRIDNDALTNCQKLQTLSLATNKITEINGEQFSGNYELSSLDLSGNLITSNNINFKQQKMIWAYENEISNAQNSSLQKLTKLYLQNNKIEEIAANSLSSLNQLVSINLSNNKLKVIYSFGVLSKLNSIDLRNNQINAFDQNFIDDTRLYYLYMKNNICLNADITDNTISNLQMRIYLLKCFENFDNLVTGNATLFNLQCRLNLTNILQKPQQPWHQQAHQHQQLI